MVVERERGTKRISDVVTSPRRDKRGRQGQAPGVESDKLADQRSPLKDPRVTLLKRQSQVKNRCHSIDSSTGTLSGTTNTVPSQSGAASSLDSSLDNTYEDERFFLSPAVDLDRAKAVYCPVKGPVRMHTCWLPSNLTVSQSEYEDTPAGHVDVGGTGQREPQGSVDSLTVDMEDKIESSPEMSNCLDPSSSKSAAKVAGFDGRAEQKNGADVGDASPSSLYPVQYQEDPIIVESYGGYRSAIGTHGCHQGTYVYEVKVACDVSKKGFGVRFGWATKGHELERILHQPVGAIHGDGYGFNVVNMHDDNGSVFYSLLKGLKKELPVSKSTANPVKKGDVFGVVIHLGNDGRPFETTADDIVLYRTTQRHHIKSPGPEWMKERKPLTGSYMELFWNGKSQGRMFQDEILESTYYPMVSLYTNLGCMPDGERDPQQRARVQVTFRSGAFQYAYPKGVKSLEHKISR